jgi:hypothetical protein
MPALTMETGDSGLERNFSDTGRTVGVETWGSLTHLHYLSVCVCVRACVRVARDKPVGDDP